jgi:hypothetical protein
MILSDVLERFSQDAPLSVMAPGIMENALNPPILDHLVEDVAETQFTNTLLFSTIVDLRSVVVGRRRPSIHAAFPARRDGRGDHRRRLRQARGHRDRRVGRAGPGDGREVGSGPRGDERRPGGLAARFSRSHPRGPPSPRDGASAPGVADDPRRGLARPRVGRPRPPADVGHRRGPVGRRSGPGTVAAGPDLGDRRGERSRDRRPQLWHDRLPLRNRAAERLVRDPTTGLDAPWGVRRARSVSLPQRRKHPRGPKKPKPQKQSGVKIKQVATAKILEARHTCTK